MDSELHCASCKQYYQLPIYLPCSHSICYTCALSSIRSINPMEHNPSLLNMSFTSDLDKLSFRSDYDSGISLSSRPSSLLLPPALPEISCLSTQSIHENTYSTCLECPQCSKMIYMDKSGVKSLPKNRLLADIINRYHKEKCQLCHPSEEQIITRICKQCQIGYCDQCQEQYHPMRGPFSNHNFINVKKQSSNSNEKYFCQDHLSNLANFYCLDCRLECCQQCSTHINHEIISIYQAVKMFKVIFF